MDHQYQLVAELNEADILFPTIAGYLVAAAEALADIAGTSDNVRAVQQTSAVSWLVEEGKLNEIADSLQQIAVQKQSACPLITWHARLLDSSGKSSSFSSFPPHRR